VKALRGHGSWCNDCCPLFKVRWRLAPTRTFRMQQILRLNTCPSPYPRPLVRCKNTPAPPQYFTVANQRIKWRWVGAWSLSKLPHPSVHHLLPFTLFYSLSAHQSFTVVFQSSVGTKQAMEVQIVRKANTYDSYCVRVPYRQRLRTKPKSTAVVKLQPQYNSHDGCLTE
jgi:hypothetical protein